MPTQIDKVKFPYKFLVDLLAYALANVENDYIKKLYNLMEKQLKDNLLLGFHKNSNHNQISIMLVVLFIRSYSWIDRDLFVN